MKKIILSILPFLYFSGLKAQSVNYIVEIVQFNTNSACQDETVNGVNEEITWHCWAKDNDQVVNWTNDGPSDCYGADGDIPVSLIPINKDLLSINSSNATSVLIQLEGWEDDDLNNSVGSTVRCDFNPNRSHPLIPDEDDFYSIQTTSFNFRNDPACQWNAYTANSGSFSVTIRIKWEYTVLNGGANITECGNSTDLSAQGNGQWSIFSGSNGSFANTLDPNSSFSGDINTSYVLLWSSLTSCVSNSVDSLNVDFFAHPIPNMTSSVFNYCEDSPVDFSAQNGQLYEWYVNSIDSILQPASGNSIFTYSPSLGDSIVYVDVDDGNCSTIDSITFSVLQTPDPSIIFSGGILSTQTFTAYQWYLNGSPIAGATTMDYTPSQNGNYYVEVANSNTCTGASSPYAISSIGIDEYYANISLYPNPTKGVLHILGIKYVESLSLFNQIGEKIQILPNSNQFDLSNLESGLYLIRIMDKKGMVTNKRVILSK